MAHPSLHILIAGSEAIPYAKTGGLADVVGALSLEFAKLDHDVIVVLPYYRCVKDSGRTFRAIGSLRVPTSTGLVDTVIEEDRVPVGEHGQHMRVWAFRHDAFFDRAGLYQDKGIDYPDNLDRFVFFSRAVLEAKGYLKNQHGWKPDILHLHDWQSTLCAVYLKTIERERKNVQGARIVLTLHNVGYQGIFPGSAFARTGLAPSLFTPSTLEFHRSVNLLKGGIVFSDYLTTVSPTYAREILTPEFGFGLEGVLKGHQDRLTGILNGIDIEQWNPETDPHLPAHYSLTNHAGKNICKKALQREFQLPEKDVPLVSVIARLTSQKGSDLVGDIIPDLLTQDVQLVILGTGDPAYEERFRVLQKRFPQQFGLVIGFDELLAHRIEAGADLLLMPSRYEPCGLSQLYSLRYGTVPVVRKTGGLADTVVPFTPTNVRSGKATGFQFEAATAESFLIAVREALAAYRDRSTWSQLISAGMKTDVSWARSAQAYNRLFQSLIGTSKAQGSRPI
jgi:starch synthase